MGTVTIESSHQNQVLVHVVEEFPDNVEFETGGFRHKDKPAMGEISSQQASISQIVDDEPATVHYGIKLAEHIEEITFNDPNLQEVQPAAFTRSGTACDNSDNIPGTESEESTLSESSPAQFSMDTAVDSESSSTDTLGWDRTDASSAAIKEAIRQANDNDESEQTAGKQKGDQEVTNQTEAPANVKPIELTDPRSSTQDDETCSDSTTPEDNLDPRRSVDARLDWLSARVDEFAAYATALEDLIDKHGPAPEFIDRIEDDLTTLEAGLQSVQTEIETVQETQNVAVEDLHQKTDDLDQRLDEARGRFDRELDNVRDDLDKKVERIDTTVAKQGDTLKAEIETLDGRVSRIDDDVQDIRETTRSLEDDLSEMSNNIASMRAELSDLRTNIQELTEFKDSLANVFETPATDSAHTDDR
ncbi:hypothetical protein [Haloarcula nitratireducens]|uniref:Chromosome segregation ATPase-like protein n=1 Tax=Haloarcula nitratireducens TaxID=2487749 RepID=A0AAW4PH70_9EURY|nr:hypothetical protein [Halomicroarcula nitratireducens]MBX0297437.1 hypothetical protein [Halomicroarcula nitratireducens]